MRILVSLFFIVVVFISSSYASIYQLEKYGIFGFRSDTTEQARIESFALSLIDSLKSAETLDSFPSFPSISGRYSFSDLPCVKLYKIVVGSTIIDGLQDTYRYFLFNTCDSTIYPFHSNWLRFTKVLGDNLVDIYENGKILELVKLYLFTLRWENSYYILDDLQTYKDIFENSFPPHMLEDEEVKEWMNDDIKKVGGYVRPLKIQQKGEYYHIQLWTWEKWGGDIESWYLRISRNTFEVVNRLRFLRKMGPSRSS